MRARAIQYSFEEWMQWVIKPVVQGLISRASGLLLERWVQGRSKKPRNDTAAPVVASVKPLKVVATISQPTAVVGKPDDYESTADYHYR